MRYLVEKKEDGQDFYAKSSVNIGSNLEGLVYRSKSKYILYIVSRYTDLIKMYSEYDHVTIT